MNGDVIWDSVSMLDFYMTEGSSLKGAFINDETYAGSGGDGYCSLYINEDASWVVTKDSEITSLFHEGSIIDEDGKSVTIVGTDGKVYVDGESQITVTVTNYSDTTDMSATTSITSYTEYQVDKPIF